MVNKYIKDQQLLFKSGNTDLITATVYFFKFLNFIIFSGQKDCDLPKSSITSLHGSNSFGQVQNSGNDSNGNGRLHVSSGLCNPHDIHQDQVKKTFKKYFFQIKN